MPDPTNPQQYNKYTYTLNNPLKYTDSSGNCAEYGDDECWSVYDQIVQMCPECHQFSSPLGTTLDAYGYNYQKEIYNRVKNGWRPSTEQPVTQYGFLGEMLGDAEFLAGVGDYYNERRLGQEVFEKMGKAGRIVPGPFTTGLVAGGSLIESRSEGKSWGRAIYGAGIDVMYDMAVDGISVLAGTMATIPALESGPGAAIPGTATYLSVQVSAMVFVDPLVDNFTDRSYEQIMRMTTSLNVTTIQTQPVVYPFGYPDR